jgi:hypothetical protein
VRETDQGLNYAQGNAIFELSMTPKRGIHPKEELVLAKSVWEDVYESLQ